jgi:hypothetical protein
MEGEGVAILVDGHSVTTSEAESGTRLVTLLPGPARADRR